jgi:hypothetical protein
MGGMRKAALEAAFRDLLQIAIGKEYIRKSAFSHGNRRNSSLFRYPDIYYLVHSSLSRRFFALEVFRAGDAVEIFCQKIELCWNFFACHRQSVSGSDDLRS